MSTPTQTRLTQLRSTLSDLQLDGFVVPICDEHMSEYVGDYAQRLAWLTGFTGSAGSAIVLSDKAALFVDGRYTAQADEQVPAALYEHLATPEHSMTSYLAAQAQEGQRIGFDPLLHSQPWVEAARRALEQKGAQLVAVEENPIDLIWEDQPPRPALPIVDHAVQYAGKERQAKIALCAQTLRQAGADLGVISSLDGVAWTLNLRGRDIDHSPVAFGFLILHSDGNAALCMETQAMDSGLKNALDELVQLHPYDACIDVLKAAVDDGTKVLLDPNTAVSSLFSAVEDAGGQVLRRREPCTLPKACKNPVEQDGTRAAHVRDGAALTRFLAWFDSEAPKGTLTELSAADRLAVERARVDLFQDLSFRTISAAAHHAALPHYSVTPESNIEIPTNGLYLVDSGGQYLDGTTDVTRTVQVGDISEEAKKRYTQVLKGHIAVATARFPAGTPGRAIDTLARVPLWADGADFDHGTGHGVGSYLNVHEGPQRIAKANADEPLKPGMICSNEPGYYREGDFGIRIENLVIVQPMREEGDERSMYGFETITLAPIDRRPILISLLTADEIAWLDAYHARVLEALSPLVGDETLSWLRDQTAPLV
jgi:Xaa-Pro aminopeptidase